MVNKLMRFCCHFWLSLCDARLMNTLNGLPPTQCEVCEDLLPHFLSLYLSHLLSLRQAFLLLRSTRILSHFDIFLWHATAGTVRRLQVRIVQANRHIWCQLEREEEARLRRPFYFPQPPHYRHVVSSIAHWPSPLWRRKWKVTRNFLGNSRLQRFTINCWQFRLIVHHAWLSVNCHCLALSLCLSISISLVQNLHKCPLVLWLY